MIKTERYNNISRDIEKRFQLKPGEVKSFSYTHIMPDPHPDSLTGKFMPEAFHITKTCMFYDPNKEESVEIAAIRRIKPGGDVEFSKIAFRRKEGCVITLSGDNPEHRGIYTYMMLHPWNETNEYRPKGETTYFKLDEPEKDAAENRKARKIRFEAIQTAVSIPQSKVRQIAAALGYDSRGAIELLRDVVEAYADKYPESFLTLNGDAYTGMKAAIAMALKPTVNVLRYLANERKIIWSDTKELICIVPPGKKAGDYLFEFMVNNEAGSALYDRVQFILEDKIDMGEPELAVVEDEKKEVGKKKEGTKKSVGTITID